MKPNNEYLETIEGHCCACEDCTYVGTAQAETRSVYVFATENTGLWRLKHNLILCKLHGVVGVKRVIETAKTGGQIDGHKQ
jgi:hypothetical protein